MFGGRFISVADPGGLRGLTPNIHPTPHPEFFLLACQYMKIPADLDPKPPLRTPPPHTHTHTHSKNS